MSSTSVEAAALAEQLELLHIRASLLAANGESTAPLHAEITAATPDVALSHPELLTPLGRIAALTGLQPLLDARATVKHVHRRQILDTVARASVYAGVEARVLRVRSTDPALWPTRAQRAVNELLDLAGITWTWVHPYRRLDTLPHGHTDPALHPARVIERLNAVHPRYGDVLHATRPGASAHERAELMRRAPLLSLLSTERGAPDHPHVDTLLRQAPADVMPVRVVIAHARDPELARLFTARWPELAYLRPGASFDEQLGAAERGGPYRAVTVSSDAELDRVVTSLEAHPSGRERYGAPLHASALARLAARVRAEPDAHARVAAARAYATFTNGHALELLEDPALQLTVLAERGEMTHGLIRALQALLPDDDARARLLGLTPSPRQESP